MLDFHRFLITEKLLHLNQEEKQHSLIAAALCLECYQTAKDFIFKTVNGQSFLAFRGTKTLKSFIYDITSRNE